MPELTVLYESKSDSFYDIMSDGCARATAADEESRRDFHTMHALSRMVKEAGGDTEQCWSTVHGWQAAPGNAGKLAYIKRILGKS